MMTRMVEALVVLGVVIGYLSVGLITARAAWLIRHRTLGSTSHTIGIILGWPIVIVGFVVTVIADGFHDLVTQPTRREQLEERRNRLRHEITQLERDLGMADEDQHHS